MPLQGKYVVLGVCGSIACYKAADLASKLVQAGALVDVVLTESAQQFITPFTFRSLTGRPVYTNMFDPVTSAREEHVALARQADLVIVAPATATTMARLAHGLADDTLSLTVLATKAPILLAPAMDSQMWEAAATQENVETLRRRGAEFVGPESGRLASGNIGAGRLSRASHHPGCGQAGAGPRGRPRRQAYRRKRRRHARAHRPGTSTHRTAPPARWAMRWRRRRVTAARM